MPALRPVAAILVLVSAISCLDTTVPPPRDAQLRVVNASNVAIDITVDGTPAVTAVRPTSVTALFIVPGAHHLVAIGTNNTAEFDLASGSQGVATAVVYTRADGAIAATPLDTGATPDKGKSKVRVALLSQSLGAVDIYRIQPDFQTPTRIQTPFPYLTTSPFVQSDSGYWEVFASPVGSQTKLITTGQFYVEALGRRTVVLMDSAGRPIFRVMPE